MQDQGTTLKDNLEKPIKNSLIASQEQKSYRENIFCSSIVSLVY